MNTKEVSRYYIDEHIVKLIAWQVILFTLLSLINGYTYLLLFLTLDFAIRAFSGLPSPLKFIARKAAILLHVKPKPVFAPPKKFAAALGFIFSLTTSTLLFLNIGNAAYIVGSILAFCAFLEAAFNVCIGCYVYSWFVAPIAEKRNSLHYGNE